MASTFEFYIHRLHKQLYPESSLAPNARAQLSELVLSLIIDFAKYLIILTEHGRKKTIRSREVHSATRILIKGDLGRQAVNAGVTEHLSHMPPFIRKKDENGRCSQGRPDYSSYTGL
jgi:histone H3/H4